MGLKVTTDDKGITVYRQDKQSKNGVPYSQYSIMVSSKDKEGTWHNGFIECQFKYGVTVENKTKIIINNAFYTVNQFGDKAYVKLMILDFKIMGDAPADNKEIPVNLDYDDWMKVVEGDEELPFV